MSNPLLERMAALKASSMAENTSVISNTAVTHTLSTFLIIYHKADAKHYINHLGGHKALFNYLTCYGKYPLDLELDKYPRILDTTFKKPSILGSWNLNELAELFSGKAYGSDNAMFTRAIYFTSIDLANRGLI